MEILSKDFGEFIECCVAREVKFLIVGGYALAAHGHPRATKDLDVWVMIGPDNAERLVLALEDFGMDSVGLEAADFAEPDIVVQLGCPPVRIDLLTSASGVDFETCWSRRMNVSGGAVDAGFISYEDLIANKRASGLVTPDPDSIPWNTTRLATGPEVDEFDRWLAMLDHDLVRDLRLVSYVAPGHPQPIGGGTFFRRDSDPR